MHNMTSSGVAVVCERPLVEVDGRPARYCVECEHVINDSDAVVMAELRAIADLTRQRDELLAALKAIVSAYDGPTVDIGTSIAAAIPAARAAIVKAEAR